MAIRRFTERIEWEPGDKVVALYDLSFDDYTPRIIEAGSVLTIKTIEKEPYAFSDTYRLTFEEVASSYRDYHFELHNSTNIREEED